MADYLGSKNTFAHCVQVTGHKTSATSETLVVTLVGSARNIFINIHIYRTGHTFTDTSMYVTKH